MKNKWLTFSYDDGTIQDRRLAEIFENYGLKATFNLCSGSFGIKQRINHYEFDVCFDKVNAEEVKELYSPKRGFEVAVHGKNHKNWTQLDSEGLIDDIADDKNALEALWGHQIIGSAYPCGCYDGTTGDKLKSLGLKYCRAIADTHTFALPDSFFYWQPTCHDNCADILELAQRFLDYEGETPALFYIWGHSFEFDKNDRDRWSNIEKLCKMLSSRDDVWYATNGEIYNALAGEK